MAGGDRTRRIGVIGAGISGLLTCKYLLQKGFAPIVFESEGDIGGVWRKTIQTTKLQTPKSLYQFSDFPWPPSVADPFPTQKQVLQYLHSYAHFHGLLPRVHLNSRVLSLTYHGSQEEEDEWNWCKPFGNGGEWRITVQNTQTLSTEVHRVEFVVVCAGMYSGSPNIPEFSKAKGEEGPEVFQGKVMHSMEYSAMDHAAAANLVKGKSVAVVGLQKSGMDIAMECSSANGPDSKQPCILLYRTPHWNVPDHLPWGLPLAYLYQTRFSELLLHKPAQGLLLSLLATFFLPLRWAVSKFVESHIKRKLKLTKHGMVPKHSFLQEINSCSIATVPEGFYDRVEEGSIILKKSQNFSFVREGVMIDDSDDNNDEPETLKIDLLILATGFRFVDKLKALFISSPFQSLIDKDTTLMLYRQCIHPRIPQLAFIGFSESIANLFTSEMQCRWLAELLDGTFNLPSIEEMEENTRRWDKYYREKSLGEYHHHHGNRSCLGAVQIWFNDQLCKDMGWKPLRKKGLLKELFQPYGPMDYA
ncbi:probable flavin-containing monooxygenase 1 isoform X2 [Andrographis paniculata]|uniref:probable flavin-containing monooxygenase 1 isoform X2 n=1 Tax=Andrographis paniculata TaxID=175694 RepID=UPI0021E737D6|nr:probable flavin-containing monooxygenase 1 isoform X2 [Andrographis paniculata]